MVAIAGRNKGDQSPRGIHVPLDEVAAQRARERQDRLRFGTFVTTPSGDLISIADAGTKDRRPPHLVNCGAYVLDEKYFSVPVDHFLDPLEVYHLEMRRKQTGQILYYLRRADRKQKYRKQ